MAFVRQALKLPPVPETEEIIDSMSSDLFSFAVTKEAVYLTTNKDMSRFPLSAIRRVTLDPARGLTAGIALSIFVTIIYTTILTVDFLNHRQPALRFILVTACIFFIVQMVRGFRGRYRLWIDLLPGFAANLNDVEPSPEMVTSAKNKAAALEAQTRFLAACKRVGLWVADNRLPAGSDGMSR
jgi:hypothetical protein